MIISADLNSISRHLVILFRIVEAREPVDFLDLGITVISLWDMAGLEDILFAPSILPKDLRYGIV